MNFDSDWESVFHVKAVNHDEKSIIKKIHCKFCVSAVQGVLCAHVASGARYD